MNLAALIRLRSAAAAGACAFVLLAVGAMIPITASQGGLSRFLGALLAVAAILTLFAVPVRLLPGLTIVATLLIPASATMLPRTLQGAAFGLIPLTVWIIRAPAGGRTPTPVRALALLLGFLIVASEIFAPIHTHRGTEWLVVAEIALVLAVFRAPAGISLRSFRSLFLAVTTALAVYAVLEGFALHRNILFGSFFDHTSWWSSQHHNVAYRVTTLLGHPLFNGLVFSAASVLAASDLLENPRKPLMRVLRFMLLVAATDATHSRSAALALGVGALVVLVFSRRPRAGRTRQVVLVICFALAAILVLYGLKGREESELGQASAQTRIAVIKRASEALDHLGALGAGPGESDAFRTTTRLPGAGIDLENSYAELAVSLGLIGLVIAAATLIAIAIVGLRNRLATGETATFVAMLVNIGGFNAIEDQKSTLVLLALFAIAILTAPDDSRARALTSVDAPGVDPIAEPRPPRKTSTLQRRSEALAAAAPASASQTTISSSAKSKRVGAWPGPSATPSPTASRRKRSNGRIAPAQRPRSLAFVLWSGNVGGAETLTAALAGHMRKLGIPVTIVFVTHPHPLSERLLEAGVPFHSLNLARGRYALQHPRLYAAAIARFGANGALVAERGFMGATLRAGGYRGPIVAVEHGAVLVEAQWFSRVRRIRRGVSRFAGAHSVGAEVAVSDFMFARMLKKTHARKVKRIHNGIDPDTYTPISDYETPSDGVITVGYAGRLAAGKGADRLIEACARPDLRDSVRLLIAGDGPEQSALRELVQQKDARVEFLGVTHDVPSFWRRCDIAAVPTDNLIESFSMTTLEAMACGMPIVASRNGAIPELIVDGETGTLVTPGDVNALSAAIASYTRSAELRRAHGTQARARAEQRFHIDQCAQAYIALFRELAHELAGKTP